MVRIYNPEINREWYPYDHSETITAVMSESRYGEWVMLSTYNDVVAQKDAHIAKLKQMIDAYSDEV